MTNTNLPDHWTPTELVGAPAYLHRAAKDYAEAYALAALAQSGQGEAAPLCYMVERHAFRASPHGQDAEGHDWLEVAQNENEPGAFPVYTRPQPAQPPEAQPARVVDESEAVAWGVTDGYALVNLSHTKDDAAQYAVSARAEIANMGRHAGATYHVKPLTWLSTPTAAPANTCKLTECQGKPRCAYCKRCDEAAAPTPSQAAVTELEAQLAASLRKFVNSLSEQDDEGLIEHADSMIGARAALAAFEAKKAGA